MRHCTIVRVGPRFASPSAPTSAAAKLSFSSGPRKLATASLRPLRHQQQPHQAEFLVRLALEPHPDRIERPFAHTSVWLTFRTRSSEGVTVTSS